MESLAPTPPPRPYRPSCQKAHESSGEDRIHIVYEAAEDAASDAWFSFAQEQEVEGEDFAEYVPLFTAKKEHVSGDDLLEQADDPTCTPIQRHQFLEQAALAFMDAGEVDRAFYVRLI